MTLLSRYNCVTQQNASALLKQPEARVPDWRSDTMSEHTSPQSKSTNYVYLIEPDGDNFTKIGITDDPRIRLCRLQTGNPRLLVLRYLIPCESAEEARAIEQVLHFAFGRYAAVGEWFEVSADSVIAFWQQMCKVAQNVGERTIDEPNLSLREQGKTVSFSLAKTQQDVIDYLQANPDSVDVPGKVLAKLIGASEATVSRARRIYSMNGHREN